MANEFFDYIFRQLPAFANHWLLSGDGLHGFNSGTVPKADIGNLRKRTLRNVLAQGRCAVPYRAASLGAAGKMQG